MPPLLRADRSLTHCPIKKAALFADEFGNIRSLAMLQSCFPEVELTMAFLSGDMKTLLEFDPCGSAGLYDIFLISQLRRFLLLSGHWLGQEVLVYVGELVT